MSYTAIPNPETQGILPKSEKGSFPQFTNSDTPKSDSLPKLTQFQNPKALLFPLFPLSAQKTKATKNLPLRVTNKHSHKPKSDSLPKQNPKFPFPSLRTFLSVPVMAQNRPKQQEVEEDEQDDLKKLMSSYLGLSLGILLALAPTKFQELQTQVSELSARLWQAEEQVRQMRSRRKEDSKANARVVEIFASHRNAWQAEEKRLLNQIDAAHQEIAHLHGRIVELEKTQDESSARIQDLEREVGERDDMIGFMASRGGEAEEDDHFGLLQPQQQHQVKDDVNVYDNAIAFGFDSHLVADASKLWQDVQYESLEPLYHMKHFVPRESPWKLDGESTRVSSKLKLLEQELLNLENIGNSDLCKVPSLMRKQAKRYQALAGKIDDLCRRMQRASETAQKLMAVQTEIGKSYYGGEVGNQAKLTTRRSLDSIRNNFKDIQRNLEIWLARIIGDLEEWVME
ncbi:Ribonuclease P protein subunit P38-related protein [Prunus dulcis]|uniref:Ribonuclease P protein subunit P38-related protein n=1 Tax=Prunus dulcis TaxID=3755 RepID=A0A4Y1REW8_PRUDU|nr:Ribonuclease P protein subunit P38-related protein [Prunus dulcis]